MQELVLSIKYKALRRIMCLAVPGKIVKVGKRQVEVEYPGVGETRRALVGGDRAKEGDWVMVQMGVVQRVLSGEERVEMMKGWKES